MVHHQPREAKLDHWANEQRTHWPNETQGQEETLGSTVSFEVRTVHGMHT